MKIVILGTAHPLRGGLAAYNERLAKALQDEGHQVIIYTFSLQYPNFLFPGKSQYSTQDAPKDLDIRVEINSINLFNWINVAKRIKAERADLILVKFWLPFMGPCFGTILKRATFGTKTKVVSIIDNIIPHEKRLGDKAFSQYFCNQVDAFICMSKAVLSDLQQFLRGQEAVYHPHPIYDNFGTALKKDEAKKRLNISHVKLLLFFGFIRDYKGLDIAIEAMANDQIQKLGIKMLIAGEFYTDRKPYDDLIEKLELQDHLILRTDYIPDDEVACYFSAADMVVQPYKTATQSGVTQICYHFNKPMLVTDVGGLSEMVVDQKVGYVTKPNAAEVAMAIINFYEQERELKFVEGVKEEKEQYSWANMVDRIIELRNNLK